jgi:hypothetical protein
MTNQPKVSVEESASKLYADQRADIAAYIAQHPHERLEAVALQFNVSYPFVHRIRRDYAPTKNNEVPHV